VKSLTTASVSSCTLLLRHYTSSRPPAAPETAGGRAGDSRWGRS
jgi:hypothetical protein